MQPRSRFVSDLKKEMFEVVNEATTVSFDCWDTLVHRAVDRPTDLFLLIEKKSMEENGVGKGFYYERIRAENEARSKCQHEEITLDEIYDVLLEKYSSEMCHLLKEMEISFEIELCYPDDAMVNIFKQCVIDKKTVYIISDMYLPYDVTKRILDKCGVCGYDKIFLSSEILKTKCSGSMYTYVINKENIDPSRWCHIGDNKVSDFKIPSKYGISSYLISRTPNISEKKFHSRMVRSISIKSSRNNDAYYKIGNELYGPVLWGFIEWLILNLERENIDQVLFCARDGFFYKKAYDYLVTKSKVKSRYFFVSRKALMRPLLDKTKDLDTFSSIMWNSMFDEIFTIKDFINVFGYKTIPGAVLGKYTLTSEIQKNKSLYDDEFIDFFHRFCNYAGEACRKSRLALDVYIEALGINLKKPTAIIDLGWHGSTQAVLEELYSVHFWGYYMGFFDDIAHFKNAKGYFATGAPMIEKVDMNCNLLELVFSAPHGSLLQYRFNDNNTVNMVFGNYEHVLKNEQACLSLIQDGMMDYIRFVSRFETLAKLGRELNPMQQPLMLMGWRPVRNVAKLFSIFHFDNNGDQFMIAPHRVGAYLRNPRRLLYDYKQSAWRIGFLVYVFRGRNIWYYLIRLKQKLGYYYKKYCR